VHNVVYSYAHAPRRQASNIGVTIISQPWIGHASQIVKYTVLKKLSPFYYRSNSVNQFLPAQYNCKVFKRLYCCSKYVRLSICLSVRLPHYGASKRTELHEQKQSERSYTAVWSLKFELFCGIVMTRSSAIAGRPCDAIACQGLLKLTWKWQPRLKWPSKYFKVIKSGTNRKLVYDFLLVVNSNFCRFWEIWCETVHWPWNMPKVIDSCITWKLSCGHVC